MDTQTSSPERSDSQDEGKMNIFRQAAELLKAKDKGDQLTEEELQLINTAIIPLMVKTDGIFPEDITIGEGLEELVNLVEKESPPWGVADRLRWSVRPTGFCRRIRQATPRGKEVKHVSDKRSIGGKTDAEAWESKIRHQSRARRRRKAPLSLGH